jgi:hypothetical protein
VAGVVALVLEAVIRCWWVLLVACDHVLLRGLVRDYSTKESWIDGKKADGSERKKQERIVLPMVMVVLPVMIGLLLLLLSVLIKAESVDIEE